MPNILTDAEKAKLLPCPFCGAKPLLYDLLDTHGGFSIECPADGCDTDKMKRTKAEAIAAWNRRALPAQVEQEAVGQIRNDIERTRCVWFDAANPLPHGTLLFASPIPAAPAAPEPGVMVEGCRYAAMEGMLCNKCGRVHRAAAPAAPEQDWTCASSPPPDGMPVLVRWPNSNPEADAPWRYAVARYEAKRAIHHWWSAESGVPRSFVVAPSDWRIVP